MTRVFVVLRKSDEPDCSAVIAVIRTCGSIPPICCHRPLAKTQRRYALTLKRVFHGTAVGSGGSTSRTWILPSGHYAFEAEIGHHRSFFLLRICWFEEGVVFELVFLLFFNDRAGIKSPASLLVPFSVALVLFWLERPRVQ